MLGWVEFFIAGMVFFLTHRVPTIPRVRAHLVARLGERGFVIAYALLSLVLLVWLIVAAGRAPYIEVWAPAAWQTFVPILVMPFVCLLAAFSIGAPNPLSFGGGTSDAFDPAHPGIVGVARHGILWALALWSAAHLVPNGNLAHVLLFGGSLGFALYGMALIDRRKQRALGRARWEELALATSSWPLQSLFAGRWHPRVSEFSRAMCVRFGIALGAYLTLLWVHEWVIGVNPWPIVG